MLILVIVVNVLIYGAMAAGSGKLSWSGDELLHWGGNLGELSLHGEPWRLATALFLHASPQHIFGNMALLAIAGAWVEPRIGPVRALSAYVACGLLASLLSAWGHPGVVGVGASGAIAGLVGIIVVFYASSRFPGIRGAWIAQTVGINALYSLAPDVDWLAHLGGFVSGLAAGGVLLAYPIRGSGG